MGLFLGAFLTGDGDWISEEFISSIKVQPVLDENEEYASNGNGFPIH